MIDIMSHEGTPFREDIPACSSLLLLRAMGIEVFRKLSDTFQNFLCSSVNHIVPQNPTVALYARKTLCFRFENQKAALRLKLFSASRTSESQS